MSANPRISLTSHFKGFRIAKRPMICIRPDQAADPALDPPLAPPRTNRRGRRGSNGANGLQYNVLAHKGDESSSEEARLGTSTKMVDLNNPIEFVDHKICALIEVCRASKHPRTMVNSSVNAAMFGPERSGGMETTETALSHEHQQRVNAHNYRVEEQEEVLSRV